MFLYLLNPGSHTAPYYVEVDTETPATAFGIVLMKRCDNVGQYTKTYKVQVFSTGVWKTVHEEVRCNNVKKEY